ncbi:hypothetical protein GCM10014719_48420 [Planomonospora parontospora subsp. antibiotica]|nr:hypothetical protein GCM10014719_48420 [Planomonospora parontospora subsp. antibiotica]GII17971.1 hypothetical protein Ppa05_46970 [Planomonospora parontospora subsp. antibiotica]
MWAGVLAALVVFHVLLCSTGSHAHAEELPASSSSSASTASHEHSPAHWGDHRHSPSPSGGHEHPVTCDAPAAQAASGQRQATSCPPPLIGGWPPISPAVSGETSGPALGRHAPDPARALPRSGAYLLNLLCESRV